MRHPFIYPNDLITITNANKIITSNINVFLSFLSFVCSTIALNIQQAPVQARARARVVVLLLPSSLR